MKAFEADANTIAGVKYKKGYLDHLDLLFIQIIGLSLFRFWKKISNFQSKDL